MLIRHVMINQLCINIHSLILAPCNIFGCRLLYLQCVVLVVVDAMMMFEHRVNVLTHELKHQCRIGDVSHCTTPVDRHKMASSTSVEAPYLRGNILFC